MVKCLPTLRRAWPREELEAAMCVQGVDVQCVLQFTLIHAAGCALHRRASRVIHRSKLFSEVFCFRSAGAAPRGERGLPRPTQTRYVKINPPLSRGQTKIGVFEVCKRRSTRGRPCRHSLAFDPLGRRGKKEESGLNPGLYTLAASPIQGRADESRASAPDR